MADFTQINQEIDDNINQNGVKAITGAKMNTVLKDMVSAVNIEKQDTIPDIEDIRDGAAAGATAFQKPSEGIPSTDMDEQVQAALDNAENAVLYSEQSVGITDQQRNTALANVSNQTANSTTGKMGYKVLDPTKTFASQVTAENTIYEIRDVFDLNNGSVTIPTGCELRFTGGRVKNATINYNGCVVRGESQCFENITASGVINGCVYVKWFGDNAQAINTAFSVTSSKLVFETQVYTITSNLVLENKSNIVIDGNNATIKAGGDTSIGFGNINHSLIKNLIFDGDHVVQRFVRFVSITNSTIEHCEVKNIGYETEGLTYGMYFVSSNNVTISQCGFKDILTISDGCQGINLYANENNPVCKNFVIRNCRFEKIKSYHTTIHGDAIYVMGFGLDDNYANVLIDSCVFIDCERRALKSQAKGVTISNCSIYDTENTGHLYPIVLGDSFSRAINNTIKINDCTAAIQIYTEEEDEIIEGQLVIEDKVVDGIVVSGNVIECNGYGIKTGMGSGDSTDGQVVAYNNLIISDNTIKTAGTYGIHLVGRGDNIVIKGNTVTRRTIDATVSGIGIIGRIVTITMEGHSATINCKYTNVTISDNILNSHFNGGEIKNTNGIYINNLFDSIITNNIINDHARAIFSIPGTGIFVDNVVIKGNTIYNASAYGVCFIDRAKNTYVVDNNFKNCTIADVYVGATCEKVLVDNNKQSTGKNMYLSTDRYVKCISGTTAQRPNNYTPNIGQMYFDETLGKPIFVSSIDTANNTVTWVDATGATV